MSTVGKPCTMTPVCAVGSPRRAARLVEHRARPEMLSGGALQWALSLTRAAGMLPMSTVLSP